MVFQISCIYVSIVIWFKYGSLFLLYLGEFKTKKVLVQHVETLSSSEKTIDIVQSFVVGMTVFMSVLGSLLLLFCSLMCLAMPC